MIWMRKHWRFVLLYIVCALALGSRVPLSGVWQDEWISTLLPVAPSAGKSVAEFSSSEVEVETSEPRWGIYARRQLVLAGAFAIGFLAFMPFRPQTAAALAWADVNYRSVAAVGYMGVAAWLCLNPPCTRTLRYSPYMGVQRSETVYRSIFSLGLDKISYGVLLTEQAATLTVFAAAYVAYCAFRSKQAWPRPN